MSARNFFSKLDLNLLDAESANIIRTEILTDAKLDTMAEDTQEYKMVMETIKEIYPNAIGKGTEVIVPTPVVEEPPVVKTEKQTKEQLQTRLKLLKKMLEKNPDDKTLKTRKKLVEKMILKA